ncbi:MAG: DEAD/DEAH box helicase [Planctomycetales bacterium]|nr:DEAD/DEAH box helicase [Planctomycetales bacterium]
MAQVRTYQQKSTGSSLCAACSSNFTSGDRDRGESYFRSGSVRSLEIDGLEAEAVVYGSSRYSVIIRLHRILEGDLLVHCDCPRFADGLFCKHLWATLRELEPRVSKLQLPRTIELWDIDDEDLLDEDLDSERDGMENSDEVLEYLAQDRYRIDQRDPEVPQSHWAAAIGRMTSLPNVSKPPVPTFRTRQAKQPVYLVNGGEWSRNSAFQIHLLSNPDEECFFRRATEYHISLSTVGRIQDDQERSCLQLLLAGEVTRENNYYGYSYGSPTSHSSFLPETHLLPTCLPSLIKTQRFYFAPIKANRFGDARLIQQYREFQLVMRLDHNQAEQAWSLTGELQSHSDANELQVIPASEVELVHSDSGVVVVNETIGVTQDARWLKLVQASPLSIPEEEIHSFLEAFFNVPVRPKLQLPEQLQVQETVGVPQARLEILPSETNSRALVGDVFFEYAPGCTVAKVGTKESVYSAEENTLYVRDYAAEQAWLQLDWPDFSEQLAQGQVSFPMQRLAEVVKQLLERNWQVYSHGLKVRQPGTFNLSVSSGVDWFELDAQVQFDELNIGLPALLDAVRRNDAFVKLDDGSQGMLPQAWLDKYGRMAGLAEEEDGKLRFKPSQALMLDALLSEQENAKVDASFTKIRKKLQSFNGIKPKNEPKSFQGDLRNYQKDGLGWLHFLNDFNLGGCLADDMGLGKTIQILSLLEARRSRRLKKDEQRLPSLVVVPKSLIFNWMDEAARFTPKLKVANYTGTERKEIKDQLSEYDVVITTYGTLRRDITEGLGEITFDYAILDEAQAIKNEKSQAAKACRLIHSNHRLAMTGTPVENHLGDLWSLFEFLNPGMLGSSTAFNALARGSAADDDGRNESLSLLSKALQPFILRRTKQQVLTDLPQKTEQTLYCSFKTTEAKKYRELREYYRAQLTSKVQDKGLKRSKIHVLEALLRLRQAACHFGLLDKTKAKQSSAKVDVLMEQLDEVVGEGHKALVFSQFTSLLSIVKNQLDQKNIPFEYLDGKTRDREARVKRFQEDANCPVFLISLKAGGSGLNLTAADYVYILDPWWNPAVEAQAIDRAHRIGQDKPVFAYRIICRDTVEEKILDLQKSKRDLADAIISANDSLISSLTMDDLQLLLS